DLQALAGEVELLLQRGFLRFGRGQGLDRDQHVEVGLGGAGDQRVAGRFQGEVGSAAQCPLAAHRVECAEVEMDLAEVNAERPRRLNGPKSNRTWSTLTPSRRVLLVVSDSPLMRT